MSIDPDPASSPRQPLRRIEAEARARLLEVHGYTLDLDLTVSDTEFRSTTAIAFTSGAGETFLDLHAREVSAITLDGISIDPDRMERGRLPLDLTPGEHRLAVEATMGFRTDGEGLHRTVDPVDGRAYVYGMSFMDAAPSWFACFDQPDLKATYDVTVRAPEDWVVFGNGAAEQSEASGLWTLRTTPPLSTYFVTLVAGPYEVIRDHHDGIDLSLSARASLAATLHADADDILTVTKQCFDEFHRLFGIRYPFGAYHQAFVPEFNAGAMENPGCVTFRDQMLFDTRVSHGDRVQRATTISHEMAHQWFGNLVTPVWWDDLWLNESFAEYLGNRVAADATAYSDAWAHQAWSRRQWGLRTDSKRSTHPVAGNGAEDAQVALSNFDGISYAKGSCILKSLAARLGDEVFFAGTIDHLTRARFGNATMSDLVGSWERAGAADVRDWLEPWLLHAGADTVRWDREHDEPEISAPSADPVRREHPLTVTRLGSALVIDAKEESWGLYVPDAETLEALPQVLPQVADPDLLAGVWNNVRSGYQVGEVAPDAVVDLAVAAPPVADTREAPGHTGHWLATEVLPLATAGSRERVLEAYRAATDRADSGSDEQLLGLRMQVRLAGPAEVEELQRLRSGAVPTGIHLDLDLRWRVVSRLAALGALDRRDVDAELEREVTVTAQGHHAFAVAAMPTPEGKRFAWERFTGAVAVPNYELNAAGSGMWQGGQREFTDPYVQAFADDLPGTVSARSGWVLAQAAGAFFPKTIDPLVREVCTPLESDEGLPGEVRRSVADGIDALDWLLAVRERYPS